MTFIVPQRIPPLAWRRPAVIWTPAALAAAIAWPCALVGWESAEARLIILGEVATFVLALLSLATSWATGRPPKTRRVVLLHVLIAAACVALIGPSALDAMLGTQSAAPPAVAPLALVIGLPTALVSGLLFSWIALTPRPAVDDDDPSVRVVLRGAEPF